MKHTKGEWVIDRVNNMVAVMRQGTYEYIADTQPNHFANSYLTDEECRANAHLIAAAPDMYEALKAANSLLNGELQTMAMRALAKAEGKGV